MDFTLAITLSLRIPQSLMILTAFFKRIMSTLATVFSISGSTRIRVAAPSNPQRLQHMMAKSMAQPTSCGKQALHPEFAKEASSMVCGYCWSGCIILSRMQRTSIKRPTLKSSRPPLILPLPMYLLGGGPPTRLDPEV